MVLADRPKYLFFCLESDDCLSVTEYSGLAASTLDAAFDWSFWYPGSRAKVQVKIDEKGC